MAGDVATITSPGLDALIARLKGMRAAMAEALVAGNAAIEDEVRQTLVSLYGERLAALWQIETTVDAATGRLASVRVYTDDKRVRGYEFGTRPHPIAAHQPPRTLAFEWAGTQAFFVRVNHPGTRPNDHRESVKIALATSAREQWKAALEAALRSGA